MKSRVGGEADRCGASPLLEEQCCKHQVKAIASDGGRFAFGSEVPAFGSEIPAFGGEMGGVWGEMGEMGPIWKRGGAHLVLFLEARWGPAGSTSLKNVGSVVVVLAVVVT